MAAKSLAEAMSPHYTPTEADGPWALHPDGVIREVSPPVLSGFMVDRVDGGVSLTLHRGATGSGFILPRAAARHIARLLMEAAGDEEGSV